MVESEKLTLKDVLPEIVVRGIDYSLLTQREWHFFKIYSELREELSKKYPNPCPEDEEDTLDDYSAQKDVKAPQFRKVLMIVGDLLEKIDTIKMLCTNYEIHCIRLYCKYLVNLFCEPENNEQKVRVKKFLSIFQDTDIYEIVESYFKIMQKYGLSVFEEPYYWFSSKRKREIKYEGEMLKRSTFFGNHEIRISLLEEIS